MWSALQHEPGRKWRLTIKMHNSGVAPVPVIVLRQPVAGSMWKMSHREISKFGGLLPGAQDGIHIFLDAKPRLGRYIVEFRDGRGTLWRKGIKWDSGFVSPFDYFAWFVAPNRVSRVIDHLREFWAAERKPSAEGVDEE